jgi:uncharacterized protein YjbJ (UPF0337 family)
MRKSIMASTKDKVAGVTDQAVGKAKGGLGKATGSAALEAEGLAQEAKGKAEISRRDATSDVERTMSDTPSVERAVSDHTIGIVTAILVLTVLIQVILVKSWT